MYSVHPKVLRAALNVLPVLLEISLLALRVTVASIFQKAKPWQGQPSCHRLKFSTVHVSFRSKDIEVGA